MKMRSVLIAEAKLGYTSASLIFFNLVHCLYSLRFALWLANLAIIVLVAPLRFNLCQISISLGVMSTSRALATLIVTTSLVDVLQLSETPDLYSEFVCVYCSKSSREAKGFRFLPAVP